MTTKELIYGEIDKLDEKALVDLYEVIKRFTQSKQSIKKSGLMGKLREIQIDAPEDFATNLDQYLSGEKHV